MVGGGHSHATRRALVFANAHIPTHSHICVCMCLWINVFQNSNQNRTSNISCVITSKRQVVVVLCHVVGVAVADAVVSGFG